MGNRNLLPLPQYIFILFFIRARGPGIRRARRVCVLARARIYAKGKIFLSQKCPRPLSSCVEQQKKCFLFFLRICPSFLLSFLCFGPCFGFVLSTFFILSYKLIADCALVVYFHHKTHALTPPHEEQNDDDDINLFCYHYFSASDGWHGLDADDFLFDDGDDDEEDELLLEKDEYDQTTTKPPPTNRRGSRWE